MGHTLVARFDEDKIRALIPEAFSERINKIPFGRNCDREASNKVLPYHMTIMHWSKEEDSQYLPKMSMIHPSAASISVCGAGVFNAEEGSRLLYLSVKPGEGYQAIIEMLEGEVALNTSSFLHITLAVDMDHRYIDPLYSHVIDTTEFPFTLRIDKL